MFINKWGSTIYFVIIAISFSILLSLYPVFAIFLVMVLAPYVIFIIVREVIVSHWVSKGNYALSQKEFDNALYAYNKVIKLKPALAIAYHNRGMVYGYKSQNDLAISDYTKAIELEELAGSYNNRGTMYKITGQYDKAISDFDKAIELDEKHLMAYINKADTYEGLGRNFEAIEAYKLYILFAPPYDHYTEIAKQNIINIGGTI